MAAQMDPNTSTAYASPARPCLVVIPCLDEAAHIEALIDRLGPSAERLDMKIVVADGGSTDGTQLIVEVIAAANPRVALLHNPKKIQSAAINLAIEKFGDGFEGFIRDRRAWRLSGKLLRPADRGRRSRQARIPSWCRWRRKVLARFRRPPPSRRIPSSGTGARRIVTAPRAIGPITAITPSCAFRRFGPSAAMTRASATTKMPNSTTGCTRRVIASG